jgi:hypothetical protein
MSWISAAELAKQTGVSRAAVTQAIKKGRIPADAVRRAGGRVLVEESAGMKGILKRANVVPAVEHQAPPPMLSAETAELASLFAWGCVGEPEPPPPDVSHLEREIRRLQHQLECTRERERRWQVHYEHFRDWILNTRLKKDRAARGGWVEEDLCMGLWKALGDQPEIGDVMVMIREEVIAHLKHLDAVSMATQFPDEQRSRGL